MAGTKINMSALAPLAPLASGACAIVQPGGLCQSAQLLPFLHATLRNG